MGTNRKEADCYLVSAYQSQLKVVSQGSVVPSGIQTSKGFLSCDPNKLLFLIPLSSYAIVKIM